MPEANRPRPNKVEQAVGMMKENHAEIIRRKEAWYDKLIAGTHLTLRGIDIIIALLLIAFVLLVIAGALKGRSG